MTDKNSPVSGVADRYATALFELALQDSVLETTEKDLGAVEALLDESEDLRRLAKSPVFTAEQQLNAISAVLDKAGLKGLVGNFVRLVAQNRRLFVLDGIFRAFRAKLSSHRGEANAEVISAQPLSASHVAALKEQLNKVTGKDVTIDASVDPSLIGGLVVKVGSRQIDTSLRTKLNSLKIALKEVG
ncbi:MAG: F0F1 ATP synthase subunit delta [Hyphomicrobiales bacterium]|nr:MAG: F0F1 ATP synthase subunit delta [Hyphomicrobiales bacterium]